MVKIKWIMLIGIVFLIFWVLPRIILLDDIELEFLYKLRGKLPQNKLVWIVSIDEELERIGGGIPHDKYAKLVRQLCKKYNPYQIGFDVVFAKADKNFEDILFSRAVKEAGNVYFGLPPTQKKKHMIGFTYPIKCDNEVDIPEITSLGINLLPQVLNASAGVGHIAKSKKPGYLPLVAMYEGKLYPHLALQMAFDYLARKLHIPNKEKLEIKVKLGRYIVLKKADGEEVSPRIPIDKSARMLVNFTQCEIIPLREIMHSSLKVSSGDKERIVLVGGTKETSGDFCPTPVGLFPGVGIIASAIENIIEQKFLVRILDEVEMLGIILLICLIIGWGLPRLNLWKQILLPGIVIAGYGIFAWWLFKQGVWIEMFRPMLCVVCTSISVIVIESRLKESRLEQEIRMQRKELQEVRRKIQYINQEKAKLLQKEQLLNEKIKESEKKAGIEPVNIDIQNAKIIFSKDMVKNTTKTTSWFMLLEYIIRGLPESQQSGIHYREGFIIFASSWREKGIPKKPRETFSQIVDELNNVFREGKVVSKREAVLRGSKGRSAKGLYFWQLEEDKYRCNILESAKYIRDVLNKLPQIDVWDESISDTDAKEVKEILEKAVKLDGYNPKGYKLLGRVYSACGMNEEAERQWMRYGELLIKEINKCEDALAIADKLKISDNDKKELKKMAERIIKSLESELSWIKEKGIKIKRKVKAVSDRKEELLNKIKQVKEAGSYEDVDNLLMDKTWFFYELINKYTASDRNEKEIKVTLAIAIIDEFDVEAFKDKTYQELKKYFYKRLKDEYGEKKDEDSVDNILPSKSSRELDMLKDEAYKYSPDKYMSDKS